MLPEWEEKEPTVDELIQKEWEHLLKHKRIKPIEPTFIPIKLTGGVGDCIISLDTINFLESRYPISIYTTHVEAFKYFYKGKSPVQKLMPDFSWHLDVNTVCEFRMTEKFSGFKNKEIEELFLRQQNAFDNDHKLERLVKYNKDRYYITSRYAIGLNLNRREFPLWSLGFTSTPEFQKLDKKDNKKYITVHDGFDAECGSLVKDRSTKQISLEKWERIIDMLKKYFPKHEIIQLGAKTARPLPVDMCLINKTSIVEAFDILSQSSLHIDGDSGLVHAATRMNIPCIVMFGPTHNWFYGYEENVNLRDSPCESACFWYIKEWMRDCLIGMTPKCMDQINVCEIRDAAMRIL